MVSVMTEIADEIKELPGDAEIGVVRHPSGWWKANERWNPPADLEAADRMIALSLALAAVVIGSLVTRGAIGNLTLLLCGTAGAFVTRWWFEGGTDRRLMAATAALSATAAGALFVGIVQLDAATASSHRGLFVAAVAAVMASALAIVELTREHLVSV